MDVRERDVGRDVGAWEDGLTRERVLLSRGQWDGMGWDRSREGEGIDFRVERRAESVRLKGEVEQVRQRYKAMKFH